MTDDENTPDGWDEEAVELMVENAEDEQPESVDPDARTRQEEGWMKVYIECPDCKTPMSRTTLESEDIESPEFIHSATESRHRFACPECKQIASHVRVERVTANVGDIKEAYNHIVSLGNALLDVFRKGN